MFGLDTRLGDAMFGTAGGIGGRLHVQDKRCDKLCVCVCVCVCVCKTDANFDTLHAEYQPMPHHANKNLKKKLGLAYTIAIIFIIFTH